ncbi:MAG TPA: prepilin peptidase [Ruminiclostridium sp.]|nr:prepilin peptidase [Ruminiclostridium sp.]
MQTLTTFYILILGLVTGCFLNVCIYRIPQKQSIVRPPSHCTNCGATLRPLDLVPVFSFIFLRGRCRYCGEKVSARYPIVEGLTAIIFVVLYFRYSLTAEFAATVFLSCILICVAFIDAEYRIIPNGFIAAGLIGGIGLFVYNLFFTVDMFGDRGWYNPILGFLVGTSFLLLVSLIGTLVFKTDDAMGMGDVKLLAVIGLFLGWRLTIVSLMLSVFSAAIGCLFLVIFKGKNRKSVIPFGPFIAAGTFTTFIFGWNLLYQYVSLFK